MVDSIIYSMMGSPSDTVDSDDKTNVSISRKLEPTIQNLTKQTNLNYCSVKTIDNEMSS